MTAGHPTARDTIVAIATPPGTGAVGLVRLSGPDAVRVAGAVVRISHDRTLADLPLRTLTTATVVDSDTGYALDEALVAVMRGPRSYTGEDVVELSCHGNPVILGEIVHRLVFLGARLAEPGEFTRRAYLNGRLGLLQAEAVAELIRARSERAVRLAARELRGGLADAIGVVRERLLDLVAGLEVSLDFPDDEIGLSRSDGAARVAELGAEVERLLERTRRGRTVQDGLTVMLTGSPNVGKSSLLNLLLGTDRAIVSPIPGTTRDLVDGSVVISGLAVRLMDGAGLGPPGDALDTEGMRRARRALGESDLIVVVLDRSRPLSPSDHGILTETADHERLVVANKIDLPPCWDDAGMADHGCSALTGGGVEVLKKRIERWVDQRAVDDADEGGIVASVRVNEALGRTLTMLAAAGPAIARAPIEAALVDLRGALSELGGILGLVPDDQLLDRIFSTFCVGK